MRRLRIAIKYYLIEEKEDVNLTKAAEATRLCIQVSAVEAAEKVHVDELNVLKEKSAALRAISDVIDMLSLIGNLSLSPDGVDK
ncbi:hypothetical protein Tco_0308025 [Tanacetum coccineum]